MTPAEKPDESGWPAAAPRADRRASPFAGLLLIAAVLTGCAGPGSLRPNPKAQAAAPSAASAASRTHTAPPSLEERIDFWMRRGADDETGALAALARLQPAATSASAQRLRLYARGQVEAVHRQPGAAASAAALRELAARHGNDPRALAAAELVEAGLAEASGETEVSGELARAALARLAPGCALEPALVSIERPEAPVAAPPASAPSPAAEDDGAQAGAAGSGAGLPAACDHRLAWRALDLIERQERARGALAMAAAQAAQAQALALRADDRWRAAWSLASMAQLAAAGGDASQAARLIRQATRLAEAEGDPLLQVRVLVMDGAIADLRGDRAAVGAAMERALPIARRIPSPRTEALLLANLADVYAKSGRPALALLAVERALPIARRHSDQRLESGLLHNAALAQIAMGRIDEAQPEIARLEARAQSGRADAETVTELREFSKALGDAGAYAEALSLYHRERQLHAQTSSWNRQTALASLRGANDAERKEREIELLARDNALKAAGLESHGWHQRIALLTTLAVGLGCTLAGVVAWRLRETQRHLVASQAQLRLQSERDPLTQLANRRHVSTLMAERAAGGSFGGALLAIDIDHFKRVNDRLGHAAGDAVLVEVARRLGDAVRADDLVVRWGGEEFLVVCRDLDAAQLEALAQRILHGVGGRDIEAAAVAGAVRLPTNATLRVSVSVGHARFPLPPQHLPVDWEQALRLADQALGMAKRQGRNRAVGVASCRDPAQAGRSVEAFEAAVAAGDVALQVEGGPTPPGVAAIVLA